MNSKNFLFAAVFVILSFFAICFVWEARSALPENEGKDVSVGACEAGFSATTVMNECPYIPEVGCLNLTEVTYTEHFKCGCEKSLPNHVLGCLNQSSWEKCFSFDGFRLIEDPEGHSALKNNEGACGQHKVTTCIPVQNGWVIYYHICPYNNNNVYEIKLPNINCLINSSVSPVNESCGDRHSVTGC